MAFPLILTAISLAKQKADSQNQFAQNLNTNPLNQQPQQQKNPIPQQNNGGMGKAFSLFSKIYGGFGK